jgi:hypothetical protein
MPARRHRTKYQKNRHGTHQSTNAKPGLKGKPPHKQNNYKPNNK